MRTASRRHRIVATLAVGGLLAFIGGLAHAQDPPVPTPADEAPKTPDADSAQDGRFALPQEQWPRTVEALLADPAWIWFWGRVDSAFTANRPTELLAVMQVPFLCGVDDRSLKTVDELRANLWGQPNSCAGADALEALSAESVRSNLKPSRRINGVVWFAATMGEEGEHCVTWVHGIARRDVERYRLEMLKVEWVCEE